MDHNLSQVPKKSNTPDTEGHNGRICQTGNELAENFRRVNGLFIHGNRSHISQVLQPPIGQSTGPVAIEAVTSRAAESSTLPQKRRRDSYSTSQLPGHLQLAYQKRPLCLIKISRKMVNNTLQYLQMLSDRILIYDTISPREYEEIIVRKEMETDAVPDFDLPLTQPEEKCRKCTAADEERLYEGFERFPVRLLVRQVILERRGPNQLCQYSSENCERATRPTEKRASKPQAYLAINKSTGLSIFTWPTWSLQRQLDAGRMELPSLYFWRVGGHRKPKICPWTSCMNQQQT
ncbi:unnamed protein product [Penicillium roqueforti FM164]|uniref:Genomic scaffold, ProqFM164S02 n=1 Tax=Penicillium roqueforti (strain FM164) TaxID=1365484 RepID=W6QF76_PENRF|nr:unnamed protein product [Penicillium roqueforti FM164]